ncbi:MAG TPA: hypothetical protein VNH82_01895 [Candidatus Dormibacteraeota bacterium]|nr:hypothetical protein [Candidatus Dormibacteraeota bacterium]
MSVRYRTEVEPSDIRSQEMTGKSFAVVVNGTENRTGTPDNPPL